VSCTDKRPREGAIALLGMRRSRMRAGGEGGRLVGEKADEKEN